MTRMDDRPTWVTGAGGLIGQALVQTAASHAPGRPVIGLTRQDLDLTDETAVRDRFRRECPGLVIHCAALSRSTACEADPALARRLNVEVTRHLAACAADVGFVLLSTDLVFDGRAGGYDETAQVNPLGVYAETKAAAESIVRAHPQHTVIRTSLNGGVSPTGDRGFNEEMRRAWQEGRRLRLFTDEYRNPIPAVVTARAIWELVSVHRPGLYHLAGAERLSRWQIGNLIAARWPELNPQLEPASIQSYQGPARPADTSLNCAKLQATLSFPLPGLGAWLARHPEALF
jgi:dTDP-4-dehydrorhamnose reductase